MHEPDITSTSEQTIEVEQTQMEINGESVLAASSLCFTMTTPARRSTFTSKTSLVFYPQNGIVCCNSGKDLSIRKQFTAMNISDSSLDENHDASGVPATVKNCQLSYLVAKLKELVEDSTRAEFLTKVLKPVRVDDPKWCVVKANEAVIALEDAVSTVFCAEIMVSMWPSYCTWSEDIQYRVAQDVYSIVNDVEASQMKRSCVGFLSFSLNPPDNAKLSFSGTGVGCKQGHQVIVAVSHPTEDAVLITEPVTKRDLVAYLASGFKPKEKWRMCT